MNEVTIRGIVNSSILTEPSGSPSREYRIINLLRHRGYMISEQRLAIISAIGLLKDFTSPEDFWLSLKEKNIGVSIASVYNTLRVLTKEGVLLRRTFKKRFSYKLCSFP